MKKIQDNLLVLLDKEEDDDKNLINIIKLLDDLHIRENKYKLKSLLHLIAKIGENHYRMPNFFNKIERILKIFLEDIKKYFSETEILNIFMNNKRIVLFLLEEKTIKFDQNFMQNILKSGIHLYENRYETYLLPEFQQFEDKDSIPRQFKNNINVEIPENFYELRKIGENESTICQLIRQDSIIEFIVYINKFNISLNSNIKLSIYETNCYLLRQGDHVSLIDYAAFFGSYNIFYYLFSHGVELKSDLWNFAIHGQNSEIINLLEENKIEPGSNKSFKQLLDISIKFHHNDIANYIIYNHLDSDELNSNENFSQCFYSYNFAFFPKDILNESYFFDLCINDYYMLVEILVKNKGINVNMIEIKK